MHTSAYPRWAAFTPDSSHFHSVQCQCALVICAKHSRSSRRGGRPISDPRQGRASSSVRLHSLGLQRFTGSSVSNLHRQTIPLRPIITNPMGLRSGLHRRSIKYQSCTDAIRISFSIKRAPTESRRLSSNKFAVSLIELRRGVVY